LSTFPGFSWIGCASSGAAVAVIAHRLCDVYVDCQ
jgi:hypothetical protein